MKLLKLSFLIGSVLIMTLFMIGCEDSIDNDAVEVIEDNDSLEEVVVTNDKDVDNDKKSLVKEKLTEIGVTEDEIDWEVTAVIMEITEIEWCYVQVDEDSKHLFVHIFFQPDFNGNESFDITDRVKNILNEHYQDYTINIKGSI